MLSSWYVVGKSKIVGKNPIRIWFKNEPVVLFRNKYGDVQALLDKCPHRGAPLSSGKVCSNYITCPYHGWQFNGTGKCKNIPGITENPVKTNIHVKSFACKEEQNLIWLKEQSINSTVKPYTIPGVGIAGFKQKIWKIEVETTIEALAENLLDATHTHYVHSGLIRTDNKRKKVLATVRSINDGIEAEYHEQKQSGWIMRLLAGGANEIIAFGRFILPGIAQLEYRANKNRKAYITALCTPSKKNFITAHIVITYKWGWICKWVDFLIMPLFWIALKQDICILQLQSANIKSYERAAFNSSKLDILGPKIYSLISASLNNKPIPKWTEKTTELFI